MSALVDNDHEIGSLNAHLPGNPAQAIVVTQGQANIEVKNNILAVMPHYYGRKIVSPYEFLHDFCNIYRIPKRPTGSTEDDYKLRAISFALKGEADTSFMSLPPNTIRTHQPSVIHHNQKGNPSGKTVTTMGRTTGIIIGDKDRVMHRITLHE
ncbi:hypothetical protein SASPL_101732 [Salvia splendens]|uniref:Uncharacterized protein n=1 Tax=Salvia splendens TaxID=180675 RepID=A0A8X8YPX4_SALSN|nr:hypothetical protein SASPL_101732 [Salvia splendens]